MAASKKSIPLEYMLEKLDQGFTWDFIVKDSGIKEDSLMRRMHRAKVAGKLEKRHIRKIWPIDA